MTKPLLSYRRIDQLKTHAYSLGLTNDDAKKFGKLSKTSTWEALCETYCVDCPGRKGEFQDSCQCVERILCPVDTVDSNVNSIESRDTSGWINDGSSPVFSFTPQNSINFLDWVDFGQLLALALAFAGIFLLAMSLWRQINPLNLLPPVKVNIQIGAK
ncbi:hypothetical protein QUB49_36240 [Microcoleus sp. AT9_B4]